MKKQYLAVLGFCLLGWGVPGLMAQQGPSASGGDASGSGGWASYTIGQIDYFNATGSNGAITQGVQQPFEIQVMTGIEKTGINLTWKVYPNPVTDFLILNVDNTTDQYVSYALYGMDGKLIAQQRVTDLVTEIPFTGMANGFYLVKVFNSNNEIKTFKISKNQ